ncbi:MAG TPA: GyrI-like domain-containing protein [Devosia sp.]|nr:GyrI-like domain-containing protein [Devosia sp.]
MSDIMIASRKPQPFAAYILRLHQPEIAAKAPQLIGDVIAWVKAHGGQTTGAPFFNYVNFFPDGSMEMQVGMPTATVMTGDDAVSTGTLPGGRYASLVHEGPYQQLHEANMRLDSGRAMRVTRSMARWTVTVLSALRGWRSI